MTVIQNSTSENTFPEDRIGAFVRKRGVVLAWSGLVLFALIFPLAFVNYEVYVDEGWLGQQAYALQTHGTVTSPFFRDAPPLDGPIVIYHKLLIWAGAAMVWFLGWGLYALRSVSLLAALALLAALMFVRPRWLSLNHALMAAVVLVFTPLFFNQMIIYRPEMLVALFGFASYLFLDRGVEQSRTWPIAFAGLCAGLAGLAHGAGLAFAVAGAVVLVWERRFAALVVFGLCAALTFFPYVSGWFLDRDLFVRQAFHNQLISGNLSFPWWQPFVNLIDEHKRWFRKPEVIGISVLFLLALFQMTKERFRRNRLFWVYVVSLALVIAMAPIPKMTRYELSLMPFFSLVIAECWIGQPGGSAGWRKSVRMVFVAWSVLFFVYGVGRLGSEAFLHPSSQIVTNHRLAASMPDGSLVMAPFDFAFNEQPRLTVQSYRGARFAADHRLSAQFLERYADSLGVAFLILSPEEFGDWGLDSTSLARTFTRYVPVEGFPVKQRWLLRRMAEAVPGS
jgi:4-amino-4-deoxy-L-arabinose transferase-like glycosyltransferase